MEAIYSSRTSVDTGLHGVVSQKVERFTVTTENVRSNTDTVNCFYKHILISGQVTTIPYLYWSSLPYSVTTFIAGSIY
jgi:hypothetical protein